MAGRYRVATLVAGSARQAARIVVPIVLVAFLCPLAIAQDAEGESDETLKQEILAAMQRRADASKSFIFEWKRDSVPIDDGVLASYLDRVANAEDPSLAQALTERARAFVDIHLGGSYRLVVDGDKMRFEQLRHAAAMNEASKLVPQTSIYTFDGQICTRVMLQSSSSYPLASIMGTNETRGFEFIDSIPIVATLRGSTWKAGYQATARHTSLKGRPMALLQFDQVGANYHRYSLWCDPSNDFLVERVVKHFRGTLSWHYDITYEHDEGSGQMAPVRWKMTEFRPDGTVHLTRSSEVMSFEIGTEIPAEEFQVEIPVGAYVRDQLSNQTYIQLADDRIWILNAEEKRMSYEELMAGFQLGSKTDQPNSDDQE